MSRKLRQRKAPRRLEFQNRIEGIALNAAIRVFRLIPVATASFLMGKAWRLFGPFNARHRRALQHVEMALPEKTAAERDAIVRDMWENLGRVAAETFHIDRLLDQDRRFESVADERMFDILKEKNGCILVSFHSGNWELCVQPLVGLGYEITGIYQALRNPEADKALTNLRKDLYKGGLLSKGHSTARKILTTLKNGGIVAMMGDLRETRGIQVPFFGKMAYANPVPASLARTCNVPIVLGRVVRKKGVNFRIEGHVVSVPVTEDRQADILAATEDIHRIFEGWIRDCPEQWMWIHKKWAKPGTQKQARKAAARPRTGPV
ncbi:lysophospholipid acyltransferase family protein [Roseibium aggregatum]|uniref:Lauroyl acyltransferase n=1 Tax=Roseibium aggregatum TaxID=187304 RepID=A0A939J3X1_9HYPH|nr:lauroyl acyltransferase [Roseibium aggregatum]MBN9670590.1 lauroyl acyltransferase [Roseibium aggregatum]